MFDWIIDSYNKIFMSAQSEDTLSIRVARVGEIDWESFLPLATELRAQNQYINQHIIYIPEINDQALQALWQENQVLTFGDVTDNEYEYEYESDAD